MEFERGIFFKSTIFGMEEPWAKEPFDEWLLDQELGGAAGMP